MAKKSYESCRYCCAIYSCNYRLTLKSVFLIITALSLFLCRNSIALDNSNKSNQCSKFNSIVLQFALVQNGMQPPLSLEEIQQTLGPGMESTSIIAVHTWIYKDRILLVQVTNNDITKKMLTGKNDGSPRSRTMEQIYEKLKTATSIWFIKEIHKKLGPGNNTSSKLQNYTWHCGIGTLAITVDQNDKITTATIGFHSSNKEAIEAQLGLTHPKWNITNDSLGMSYRAWQRSF
jgi:hypothetical protein